MEYQLGFQLSCNLINKYCNINQNIIAAIEGKNTRPSMCQENYIYFFKDTPLLLPNFIMVLFSVTILEKVSSTAVQIIVDYCIIKMYIGYIIVMLELNVLKVYMTRKVIAEYLKGLSK